MGLAWITHSIDVEVAVGKLLKVIYIESLNH
jgi:hypothetical protein